MKQDHSQPHDSNYQNVQASSKFQLKQHKTASPPRRFTRLRLQSVQSQQKPAFVTKSSLPYAIFHQNILASIIRRSRNKHFPFLMQELESQEQYLIGIGKTLEDSDEEWQSLCSAPSTMSLCNSDTEASEDTLDPPSDTELYGLCAKSPPSPVPSQVFLEAAISLETVAYSSSLSPPQLLSSSEASSEAFSEESSALEQERGHRLRSGRLVGG